MGHLRRQCVKENDEDDSRAISYIQKSAVKNWPPAMIQLALYYIEKAEKDPEETTKNLETAYFWPEKARILKDPQAEVLLKEIEKKKEKLEEDFSEVTSEFAECLNMIETVMIEIKKENNKDLNLITLSNITNNIQRDEDSSSDEEQETLVVEKQENLSEIELQQVKPFVHNQKRAQNPKLLRENLRKASLAFKNEQRKLNLGINQPPVEESMKIIEKLRNPIKRAKIKLNDLHILFLDPYFSKNGRIEMDKTTNGWRIIGTHYKNMTSCFTNIDSKEVFTTGTHRKHKKSYKGFDFNFLENIDKLLKMFDV